VSEGEPQNEETTGEVSIEDRVKALEDKLNTLEKAIGQLMGLIQTQTMVKQQPTPPTPQSPQDPGNPGGLDPQRMAQMMMALTPFLQMFQPKSDELEKLIISKALDGMIGMYDLQKTFVESLMTALASSFGKKAGERLSNIIAVSEE
jgi:hypothetical protein